MLFPNIINSPHCPQNHVPTLLAWLSTTPQFGFNVLSFLIDHLELSCWASHESSIWPKFCSFPWQHLYFSPLPPTLCIIYSFLKFNYCTHYVLPDEQLQQEVILHWTPLNLQLFVCGFCFPCYIQGWCLRQPSCHHNAYYTKGTYILVKLF